MDHALPLVENWKTNETLTLHPQFPLLRAVIGPRKPPQGRAAHWIKQWTQHTHTHTKPLFLVPLTIAAATGRLFVRHKSTLY